jgi:hypothetical protein
MDIILLISMLFILLGFSSTIFILADLFLKGRASEMILKFIEKRNGLK